MSHVLAPPVGGRARVRSHRPVLLVAVGAAVGGFFLGVVAAIIAWAIAPLVALRIGIAGVAILVSVSAVVWRPMRAWLPQRTCQVAGGRLLVSNLDAAALRWGAQLGSGVRTFAVTPGLYGFLGVTVTIVDPIVVLATCTFYGAVRGSMIAAVSLVIANRTRRGKKEMPLLGLERRLAMPVLSLIVVTVLAQSL